MAGIYIHIPFCKSKCYYCDFYSCTQLAKKEKVLEAMLLELEREREWLAGESVRTIYIGGGTPSLCTPQQLAGLMDRVCTCFNTSDIEEVTVEVNPDDLTFGYLNALRNKGVNRLSIGIQSLMDSELIWMHRRHDAASALQAVEWSRRAGFENLSIDLIYGTGRMTLEQWDKTLDQVLRLGVPHISAYHLSLEPGTVLGQQYALGKLPEADPLQSEAEFLLLHDKLTAAGYEHYEISNFARPGYRSRHNSSYWNGIPYLGIGPAAHSFNGTCRRWNVADVDDYVERVPRSQQWESESLSAQSLYNEFIMTGLRTSHGVDADQIYCRFGARMLHYFCQTVKKLVLRGTIEQKNSIYYIPVRYYMISDSIIPELFFVESTLRTLSSNET